MRLRSIRTLGSPGRDEIVAIFTPLSCPDCAGGSGGLRITSSRASGYWGFPWFSCSPLRPEDHGTRSSARRTISILGPYLGLGLAAAVTGLWLGCILDLPGKTRAHLHHPLRPPHHHRVPTPHPGCQPIHPPINAELSAFLRAGQAHPVTPDRRRNHGYRNQEPQYELGNVAGLPISVRIAAETVGRLRLLRAALATGNQATATRPPRPRRYATHPLAHQHRAVTAQSDLPALFCDSPKVQSERRLSASPK
jgi:hypothetical protein